jgi:hypothetical protein
MYGVIEYNTEGKPKCEICGEHFDRVLSHVRMAHKMNERDYKTQFGFDVKKGICSMRSAQKTRLKTLKNYDTCIKNNLLKNGTNSRFKIGSKGRTRDQLSEQSKIRLIEQLNNPKMVEAMKLNGTILGKSGLGNIARWNK